MATTTTTEYKQVIGSMLLPDGASIRHFLVDVADFQGTPLPPTGLPPQTFDTPLAQEQPRGMIVKVVTTDTRTITLNPTS